MTQPEHLVLKDTTRATIREIRPDDAPRLIALFRRLSLETIRYRFFSIRQEPTPAEAEFFATVDYACRMAFVASVAQAHDEDIIGVARYDATYAPRPDQAELAMVVQDDFQHLGVGRVLLKRLVEHARASGVHEIYGAVLSDNYRMVKFLSSSGHPVTFEFVNGELLFRMNLDSAA